MDKSTKMTLGISFVFCCTLLFGFRSLDKAIVRSRSNEGLVKAEGLAEMKVKADIAELKLKITNKSETLADLNTKRLQDKGKVMDFITDCGFIAKDITASDVKTENKGEKENKWGEIFTSHQEKYFSSVDTIIIRTANFEGVEKLKNDIGRMVSDGIVISYKCRYKISDIEEMKAELLANAAKNAQKNAAALLKPFGKRVKGLHEIDQIRISVMDENQEDAWSYDKDISNSAIRKVEAQVKADFHYE